MLVIRTGIRKILVILIANREDTDLGLCCLSGLFGRQQVFEILEHETRNRDRDKSLQTFVKLT